VTAPAEARPEPTATEPAVETAGPRWAVPAVAAIGLTAVAVGTAAAAALPGAPAGLVVAAALGLPLVLVVGLLLHRHQWLVPWGAILIFSTSAELRLRVSPEVGVLKDLYLYLLVVVVGLPALRSGLLRARLRPIAAPMAAVGILAALYVLDPAGAHGTSWLFGTRLLFSVFALFLIGLVCVRPEQVSAHLVRATAAVLAFEAVFSWAQQFAGEDALVYGWGYQYGAQVRGTSGGGLRTSGTFEDPFQLAALAVLGVALGLFVARRWQMRAVLIVSGIAVLGATSVRTAWLQVAVLLVFLALRRGWWRQALTLGAVGAVAGVYLLATTTTSDRPGAPEVPLLFGLNGRSTAWAQAVQGPLSFVAGNGVGALGIGSTRQSAGVSAPPAYDPNSAPTALYAGNSAFLDSTYAQVQSDVGIVGSLALVAGLAGLVAVLVRRCRRDPGNGAAWAALAVLAVAIVDWVGRSSLASYTTGFLTMYVLGVLVAASLARERPL
jgi:hypothetical protein